MMSLFGTRSAETQTFLLWLAVAILNLISIFTTAKGAALAWQQGDALSSQLIPWGFAIAVGAIIIVLTIEAGERRLGVHPGLLVTGYLVFATVSIFFNFNYIHSRMSAPDEERAALVGLNSLAGGMVADIEGRLRQKFKVEELSLQLAKAAAEMEVEEDRPDRPGQGPLWIGEMQEHAELGAQYDEAVKRLGDATKYIKENAPDQRNLDARMEFEETHAAVESLRQEILAFASQVEGRFGVSVEFDENAKSLLEGGDRTDLWYSLNVVGDELLGILQGQWDRQDSGRFTLATLFSILIDVPIFVVVFMLGKRGKIIGPRRKRETIKKEVWQEDHELWDESEEGRLL